MRAPGKIGALAMLSALLLSGCGNAVKRAGSTAISAPAATVNTSEQASRENGTLETEQEEPMLYIQIGNATFSAVPAQNEAAEALMDMLAEGPVTVEVENYGGFEKVGELPQTLPQQDTRITTKPGDIMLYQGDSIVFFYGSNTWSYTPLGTMQETNRETLRKAFGGSETTVILSR